MSEKGKGIMMLRVDARAGQGSEEGHRVGGKTDT